jgi:SAM-dependent methyltransferase
MPMTTPDLDAPGESTKPNPYEGLRVLAPAEAVEAHLGGNLVEGDALTFAPRAFDYLVDRFAVASVLDLGSGLGHAARYFKKRGCDVLAVDGLAVNVKQALYPTVQIDLTRQPVLTRVDLVHCQEVVEHIEEAFLENLLSSLVTGRIIVMTNALPGQDGYHHVNCQPTEYWVNHLASRGCTVLAEDTRRVRKLAEADGALYLARTGLVLSNKRW